jgi:hypothetical protein
MGGGSVARGFEARRVKTALTILTYYVTLTFILLLALFGFDLRRALLALLHFLQKPARQVPQKGRIRALWPVWHHAAG